MVPCRSLNSWGSVGMPGWLLTIYYSVALAANVYSVFGLIEKPAAWRLFRYVPRDYYRRVHTMSRQKLAMKVVGWGVSAKVVFELVTDERSGN